MDIILNMNKLSHSACSKFQQCGFAYKLHYKDRIRPFVTSGALLFGSSLDNALNVLLRGETGAEKMFEQSFRFNKINEVNTYVPTSENVVYSNSDFDVDLLVEDDYKELASQLEKKPLQGFTDHMEAYNRLRDVKKRIGWNYVGSREKAYYNLLNWLSLRRKGLLMLEAYREKVLPKLEKVHSIQEYVSLDNTAGDKITGYVDLIADVKGIGTCILDNKTSSMEYEEDSVLTSPQLSLYVHILEEKYKTRKAGYIVLNKNVIKNRKKICSKCGYDGSGARHKTCNVDIEGKRCNGSWNETIDPQIHVQFITDEIPETTEAIVMENFDTINTSIKNEVYPRNLNSCLNTFGSKCVYYSKCYKGSMEGLVDLKKEGNDAP